MKRIIGWKVKYYKENRLKIKRFDYAQVDKAFSFADILSKIGIKAIIAPIVE